jgi:hypothetical protein
MTHFQGVRIAQVAAGLGDEQPAYVIPPKESPHNRRVCFSQGNEANSLKPSTRQANFYRELSGL